MMTDILKRIMTEYMGYTVLLGMNITDIDDKIIQRSNEQGIEHSLLTERYEKSFFEDMRSLGVETPDFLLRATGVITDIVDFIEKLVKDGNAYESNSSVYLEMKKYIERFGKPLLTEQNSEDLKHDHSYTSEKKDPRDFVLWKKAKEGEPSWESPWGPGRPGWHIECSAMAIKIFSGFTGGRLDIHSGGIDLKFPHHNNEEIQSMLYLGIHDAGSWADFYLHIGHLNIDGSKMSKSEKNFITIKKMLEKYPAEVLRIWFLMHKYNEPMELDKTHEALQYADNILKRINDFNVWVDNQLFGKQDAALGKVGGIYETELYKLFAETKSGIDNNLYNDFDTPGMIRRITEMISGIHSIVEKHDAIDEEVPHRPLKAVRRYLGNMMSILGFVEEKKDESLEKYVGVMNKIRDDIRTKAKESKNRDLYAISDKIRDVYMKDLGMRIMDK